MRNKNFTINNIYMYALSGVFHVSLQLKVANHGSQEYALHPRLSTCTKQYEQHITLQLSASLSRNSAWTLALVDTA